MQSFVESTLVLLISSFVCHVQTGLVVVDSSNQGRTAVPQNMDVNVPDFNLVNSNITEIDSSSFGRYTKMKHLRLDKKPLRIIGENTFAQNVHIGKFRCEWCNIHSLPANFGSCVPYIREMHLMGVLILKLRPPYSGTPILKHSLL